MTDSLTRMPTTDGALDITHLPLTFNTEELLLISDIGARDDSPQFVLHYLDEGVRLGLWWDKSAMPDVMLWISNGGRRAVPWSGRHFAVGVEPVNGLFDLGRVAVAPDDHPLSGRVGVTLDPAKPWRMRYRFAAW